MELYRRGDIIRNNKNDKEHPFFYDVPYLNGAWVVLFDIEFNIRGIIYLIGIKPINHPLKDLLGNRSSSKMTVYNIQYKTTNMYHMFFKDNNEFMRLLNQNIQNQNNQHILIKKFFTDMIDLYSAKSNS